MQRTETYQDTFLNQARKERTPLTPSFWSMAFRCAGSSRALTRSSSCWPQKGGSR